MFAAEFRFGTPPAGAATANESASGADFLMSGLFGMETPAFIQYRQNQLTSGAVGPMPQGLNTSLPGGGGGGVGGIPQSYLLIGGVILLAFFLLK